MAPPPVRIDHRPVHSHPKRPDEHTSKGLNAVQSSLLLDSRARPDLRTTYGRLAASATHLDAAVSRVRLGGMTLGDRELSRIRSIRVLMAEMNVLTLTSEAEALASDRERHVRLNLLISLISAEVLKVRLAPLAGWSPDFSVFRRAEPDNVEGDVTPGASDPGRTEHTVVIGPHWFERPYPHPGPAFNVVMQGEPAIRALARFDDLWQRGHDVTRPISSLIEEAIRRGR
jgi:hypothetical protein